MYGRKCIYDKRFVFGFEESILKLPFLKMGAVVVIAIVGGPFFVIVNGFEYLLDAFLPDNGDDDES